MSWLTHRMARYRIAPARRSSVLFPKYRREHNQLQPVQNTSGLLGIYPRLMSIERSCFNAVWLFGGFHETQYVWYCYLRLELLFECQLMNFNLHGHRHFARENFSASVKAVWWCPFITADLIRNPLAEYQWPYHPRVTDMVIAGGNLKFLFLNILL